MKRAIDIMRETQFKRAMRSQETLPEAVLDEGIPPLGEGNPQGLRGESAGHPRGIQGESALKFGNPRWKASWNNTKMLRFWTCDAGENDPELPFYNIKREKVA